ncbi:hypothetical protein Dimus_006092 [Dionaea muscipula]
MKQVPQADPNPATKQIQQLSNLDFRLKIKRNHNFELSITGSFFENVDILRLSDLDVKQIWYTCFRSTSFIFDCFVHQEVSARRNVVESTKYLELEGNRVFEFEFL